MSLFGKKTDQPAAKAVKADAKAAVSMQDLYSEGAPKKAAKAAAGKSAATNDAYRILLSPLVTEKATNLHAGNKYVFVIAKGANKISVAKAVKSAYGVMPTKVNIMSVGGKFVARGRTIGHRSDWRKAIVTLAKGETIKIYEGV